MPEEINRVVTDVLSDDLFVTEPAGVSNLKREGIDSERIHLVGDVLADALRLYGKMIARSRVLEAVLRDPKEPYCVLTLHRPANVDNPRILRPILDAIQRLARRVSVVFPVHPRTKARLRGMKSRQSRGGGGCRGPVFTEPLGYMEFIRLLSGASFLLTDSGGAQQEAFILGVPCITLRDTTERPLTLTGGMNRLAGSDPGRLLDEAEGLLAGKRRPRRQRLWYNDGCAARRIARIVKARLSAKG
jgi:UDP-N-acetylglucosamine 2-epimerase (non-hydrolysing)